MGVGLVKSSDYVAGEDWNKPFTRRGFALENVDFQLQQREALTPCHHLGAMPNNPIPQSYFHV